MSTLHGILHPEHATDAFEDRMVKAAQRFLHLRFRGAIGMAVAGVEKMRLARAEGLELLRAEVMFPREWRGIVHRVAEAEDLGMVADEDLVDDLAVLEGELAREAHAFAVHHAGLHVGDERRQGLEVRQQRPDAAGIGIEQRMGGTNAPGSALGGGRAHGMLRWRNCGTRARECQAQR